MNRPGTMRAVILRLTERGRHESETLFEVPDLRSGLASNEFRVLMVSWSFAIDGPEIECRFHELQVNVDADTRRKAASLAMRRYPGHVLRSIVRHRAG